MSSHISIHLHRIEGFVGRKIWKLFLKNFLSALKQFFLVEKFSFLFTLDSTSLTESDDELADEQKFFQWYQRKKLLIKAQFQWEAVSMRGTLERFALAFPWETKIKLYSWWLEEGNMELEMIKKNTL